MSVPVRRDESNLTAVGSTLLLLTSELGLYHYNKLVYLFEYFYIKNFGKRFTKEVFLKFPHGPVIVDYKKHITNLVELGVAKADLRTLKEKRTVDDWIYPKVRITNSKKTEDYVLRDKTLIAFAKALIEEFATLPVAGLEKFVYSTKPMIAYANSPFKKPNNSYILTSDCIKMSEHSNALTEGRRKALEHLQKYPEIDYEQQQKLASELSGLSKLRPPL